MSYRHVRILTHTKIFKKGTWTSHLLRIAYKPCSLCLVVLSQYLLRPELDGILDTVLQFDAQFSITGLGIRANDRNLWTGCQIMLQTFYQNVVTYITNDATNFLTELFLHYKWCYQLSFFKNVTWTMSLFLTINYTNNVCLSRISQQNCYVFFKKKPYTLDLNPGFQFFRPMRWLLRHAVTDFVWDFFAAKNNLYVCRYVWSQLLFVSN
jgi:hypothetical protein